MLRTPHLAFPQTKAPLRHSETPREHSEQAQSTRWGPGCPRRFTHLVHSVHLDTKLASKAPDRVNLRAVLGEL